MLVLGIYMRFHCNGIKLDLIIDSEVLASDLTNQSDEIDKA